MKDKIKSTITAALKL